MFRPQVGGEKEIQSICTCVFQFQSSLNEIGLERQPTKHRLFNMFVHNLEDSHSYFPEVASIIARLCTPLPWELAHVKPEEFSPDTRELYKEALRSPVFSLDLGNKSKEEPPVSNFIHTILIFVSALRKAARHPFGSCATIWTPFITALVIACSPDVHVL